MLAVLLDAGVTEPEAVNLAAEATANAIMVHRAERVTALLKEGITLPEAIRAMDECGEFRWRLRNALQHEGGFLRALAGWHAALDAKAFQLEQTSAQLITSFLVLVNGVVVGCIAIAIFLALVNLINRAVLW
jgi:type II secretory pathway component PulF